MKLLDHYYIVAASPFSTSFQHIAGPFARGASIYASISVSFIDTLFFDNSPDPTFAVAAMINWYTVYLDDGSESAPLEADFPQDILIGPNIARVSFDLFVQRSYAAAHMNVFSLEG